MSDQPTAAPAPKKTTLTDLLGKATAIAAGTDKNGVVPGTEGYDEASAPGEAIRWCASILRIFLTRSIEHVLQTRKDISGLAELLRDPTLKKGDAWKSDLPS